MLSDVIPDVGQPQRKKKYRSPHILERSQIDELQGLANIATKDLCYHHPGSLKQAPDP